MLFHTYTLKAVLSLAVALWCASVSADIDWGAFHWNNDVYLGRDGGGYTNGVFFSLYDLADQDDGAPWFLRPLPGRWLEDPEEEWSMTTHTLGQIMVTPQDIDIDRFRPDDVPYAGLLLFRTSHVSVRRNHADELSLTLGILGPASGAEQGQKIVHDLIGANEPEGWDYQLDNTPVAGISLSRVWRYAGDNPETAEYDLLVLGRVFGGNLESGVGTGIIVRHGRGLKRSFPSAGLISRHSPQLVAMDRGWHVYAGLTGTYYFNHIFVNGNDRIDDPESDLRHRQFGGIAGVSHVWENWSLAFSYFEGTALDEKATTSQRHFGLTAARRF